MAFPFRDATPVPVSVEPWPVDVGSVAAVGDIMRITGGGRSLVQDATVVGG